ncbi:MAG: methylated-DNA--[protein]-cysteine S-methyltransferase [Verrucomicrobia bacterium]|nr:methylated-DNA--[protein]-cysteine S-methyltransferase [Verrucomicrobiota bacterium]
MTKSGTRVARPSEAALRQWFKTTEAVLLASLAGRAPKKLPPLDLSHGTEFQRAVWDVLRGIAPGRTLTYGEVAAKIRRPRAVRAVGGACGANPVAVIVPCHRVLAANRKIGGFSGGLEWKRKLLEIEGALPPQ